MPIGRCPGQDKRFWRSEDVFEASCPKCGGKIEFWKDEPRRRCNHCREVVPNPKLDLGCAQWCKFAKDCLGVTVMPGDDDSKESQVIRDADRLANAPAETAGGRTLAAEKLLGRQPSPPAPARPE